MQTGTENILKNSNKIKYNKTVQTEISAPQPLHLSNHPSLKALFQQSSY